MSLILRQAQSVLWIDPTITKTTPARAAAEYIPYVGTPSSATVAPRTVSSPRPHRPSPPSAQLPLHRRRRHEPPIQHHRRRRHFLGSLVSLRGSTPCHLPPRRRTTRIILGLHGYTGHPRQEIAKWRSAARALNGLLSLPSRDDACH